MSDPATYLWAAFIWQNDDGSLVEIDPFHIRCWGKTKATDEKNNPIVVVWAEVGNRIFTKRCDSEVEATNELNRIRNAKLRN